MKQLVIDRFEGKYAFCEDKEQKIYAIEISELPEEAAEGVVLEISDEGALAVNAEETQRRKQALLEKQRRAFGK